jgi:hypothetical protein
MPALSRRLAASSRALLDLALHSRSVSPNCIKEAPTFYTININHHAHVFHLS